MIYTFLNCFDTIGVSVDNTGYLRYAFLLLRQEVSYKSELQQKKQ